MEYHDAWALFGYFSDIHHQRLDKSGVRRHHADSPSEEDLGLEADVKEKVSHFFGIFYWSRVSKYHALYKLSFI